MDLAFRPRRATEIVDAAVRLYRRHFGTCVTLAAVAAVPTLLVRLAGLAGVGAPQTSGRSVALGALAAPVVVAYYVLVSAAFAALSDDAVRTDAPDVAGALRRALRRAWACLGVFCLLGLIFVGAAVVAGIAAAVLGVATAVGAVAAGGGAAANPAAVGAVGLGIAALVLVPMVYVVTRLITAVPACVVEDAGPLTAVKLAWARSRGHFGHAFAVTLVCLLLLLVPMLLVAGAGALLDHGSSLGARAAGAVVETGGDILIQPVFPLATQLLYYDLRVRAEGYDVEQMVGALGRAPAAPAGA